MSKLCFNIAVLLTGAGVENTRKVACKKQLTLNFKWYIWLNRPGA